MYHLHEIEKVKGEKFEIRTVMNEIEKDLNASREEIGLIVDVLRENYSNEDFGLFRSQESREALRREDQ